MRSRVRHELKTWPEFFAATRRGHKKFELRRDDRPEGFQVGDELKLMEWDPAIYKAFLRDCPDPPSDMDIFEATQAAYTGQELLVRVDYVMPFAKIIELMGLTEPIPFPGSFVILGISLIP